MKRYLFLALSLIVLMCSALPAFAQREGENIDKKNWHKEMLNFKIKFIAQEIKLKEDQKQQFVTTYTQMEDEKRAIRRSVKAQLRNLKKGTNTEEEYEAASAALNKAREDEFQIDRRYEQKFSTFLSQKQIFEMKNAERKFQDRLIQMHKEKKGKRAKKGERKG